MTKKQQERQAAIENIKLYVQPGDTVYTILRHVSPSGMNRVLDLVVINGNEPRHITYWAAQALEWPYDNKREGVKVSGAGMDMGFHTVYTLGRELFGDGYELKQAWL